MNTRERTEARERANAWTIGAALTHAAVGGGEHVVVAIDGIGWYCATCDTDVRFDYDPDTGDVVWVLTMDGTAIRVRDGRVIESEAGR